MSIQVLSTSHMRMRNAILSRLKARIESWDIPQQEAAARIGITRPCLNKLLNNRRVFSLDLLISWSEAAGLGVDIAVNEKNIK